ncbi:MAG: hypothetical protein UY71_C0013G0011, partial [Parcubacteria group bacterium GW2011_GWB1_52_7]
MLLRFMLSQVVHQALAFGDHPKKPAARVVVFGVFLKMRGQLRDLLG